jgi:predicted nucleic acid-binding Zn ribbon protein
MPEQLQLPLSWPYVRLRRCELCGREQGQINSPICNACRYQASKHPCAIPGCDRLVARDSTTCLWHRALQMRQPRPVYTHCTECTAEMTPSTIPACATCRKQTYHLCACGCGRYRRKYDGKGRVRLFVTGHNDVWASRHRPEIACAVCQVSFRPKTRQQRLCSIACRSVWITLNPPHAHKRVLVECTVCGTQIARKLSQVRSGQDAACSPRCRYILVANKLRGRNLSLPKSLALRRDKARCRICGFDTMVEVHHIIPRRHKGPDTLDNLITLCPNHHTMADRGMISVEELRTRIAEAPPSGLEGMTA